jgi:hypothetical protein
VLGSLPPQMRGLHFVYSLQERVAAELRSSR